MMPIATEIAARMTREHAQSAHPHAPVRDVRVVPRSGLTERSRLTRRQAARVLRRFADRVEPRESPVTTSVACGR